jgi:hypothetical protein
MRVRVCLCVMLMVMDDAKGMGVAVLGRRTGLCFIVSFLFL